MIFRLSYPLLYEDEIRSVEGRVPFCHRLTVCTLRWVGANGPPMLHNWAKKQGELRW